MNIEKARQDFENLWILGGGKLDYFKFSTKSGSYALSGVSDGQTYADLSFALVTLNTAYIFYLGGVKKAEVVPEGYVIVPVEALSEVLSTAGDALIDEATSKVFDQDGIVSTWYDRYHVAEGKLREAIKAAQESAK